MRAAIHRASWSRTMKQAAVSSMVGEKRRSGMFPILPPAAMDDQQYSLSTGQNASIMGVSYCFH